jgi:hypothetical protein
MAAVFDVQWMQMVSLRKLVQFRARGVGDLIPRHTLRIALLVRKRDHRIDSCGMRHRIKASTVIKAGPKPTALHCRNLRLLDWAHTRVPSDHGAALVRRMFVDKDRVQRIWQREGLKVSCQTERARNQVCAPHPPRCAPDIYGANMSRVHYRRAALSSGFSFGLGLLAANFGPRSAASGSATPARAYFNFVFRVSGFLGIMTECSWVRSMALPIRIDFRSYANCFAQSRHTT